MASVDPYASCPCGSGQKYKFCCQKVEAYAERAQRLIDSKQFEAALKPLDEGLAKVPGNPWLLTRKAVSYLHLTKMDAAKQALTRFAPGASPSPARMGPDHAARAGNRRPGRGRRSVPASAFGLPARTAARQFAPAGFICRHDARPGQLPGRGAQAPGTRHSAGR